MKETFDHTADLGIRVRAAALDALFVEAAEALVEAFVEERLAIEPVESRSWNFPRDAVVNDQDLSDRLFDWLRSILFAFDGEGFLCRDFVCEIGDRQVNCTAKGEAYDPDRHELAREVKAITYHQFRLECLPEPSGGDIWEAEFIVDI